MIFLTRQPIIISEVLEKADYSAGNDNKQTNGTGVGNKPIIDSFGFQPIFATPLIDKVDFVFRYIACSPTYPEVNIIFESEDYNTISAAKWYAYLGNPSIKPKDLKITNGKTLEYFVPLILKDSVLRKDKTIKQTGDIRADSACMICRREYWDLIDNYFDDKRDVYPLITSEDFGQALTDFQYKMFMHLNCPTNSYERILSDFKSNIDIIAGKIFK